MKKEVKKYVAKKGAHITDEQAQLYGEYIDKNDFHTPDEIVSDARSPKSTLHSFFDWDNTEAAEKWRKQQARILLNSIQISIIFTDSKGKPISSKVVDRYESIKTIITDSEEEGKQTVYLTNDEILENPNYIDQILQECMNKIISFKNKYNYYAEHKEFKIVKPVFKAISDMENAIERRRLKEERLSASS